MKFLFCYNIISVITIVFIIIIIIIITIIITNIIIFTIYFLAFFTQFLRTTKWWCMVECRDIIIANIIFSLVLVLFFIVILALK